LGAFLAAGICVLLHCKKTFNALVWRRRLQNGLLPTIEKLSKDNLTPIVNIWSHIKLKF